MPAKREEIQYKITDSLIVVIVGTVKELKAKNAQKLGASQKENAELKQRLVKLDVLAERLAVPEKVLENQSGEKHRQAMRLKRDLLLFSPRFKPWAEI